MADFDADALLEIEEQASQLLDELTQLRNETASYTEARKALDQTLQSLIGLAETLTDVARRSGGIIETMRSIGTPELLRGQEALANEVGTLRADLAGLHQSVAGALAEVISETQTLRGSTANLATRQELGEMAQDIGATRAQLGGIDVRLTTLESSIQGVHELAVAQDVMQKSRADESAERMAALSTSLDDRAGALTASLNARADALRKQMIGLGGATLAALVVLAALILLGRG